MNTEKSEAIIPLSPAAIEQARISTPARLREVAECNRLFDAIVEYKGVKPAARVLGLHAPAIFLRAKADPEFQAQLRAAQATNLERLVDECIEIADAATKDTWAVARLQIETRMRIAGKLIPAIYGDRPQTEINLGLAVGVVSDEKQRARLIDLRGKLQLNRPGTGTPAPVPGSATEGTGQPPIDAEFTTSTAP